MLKVLVFIIFFIFSFGEVFFSPKGGCRSELIRSIQSTKSEIKIAIYSFTSKELTVALIGQAQKGRRIRIIADRSNSKHSSSSLPLLAKYCEIKILPLADGRGLMHHKFMLIGKSYLAAGSYNYSNNAEYYNYENLITFDDSESISAFDKEFEYLWDLAIPYK